MISSSSIVMAISLGMKALYFLLDATFLEINYYGDSFWPHGSLVACIVSGTDRPRFRTYIVFHANDIDNDGINFVAIQQLITYKVNRIINAIFPLPLPVRS